MAENTWSLGHMVENTGLLWHNRLVNSYTLILRLAWSGCLEINKRNDVVLYMQGLIFNFHGYRLYLGSNAVCQGLLMQFSRCSCVVQEGGGDQMPTSLS